jgi:hypothetical protein
LIAHESEFAPEEERKGIFIHVRFFISHTRIEIFIMVSTSESWYEPVESA